MDVTQRKRVQRPVAGTSGKLVEYLAPQSIEPYDAMLADFIAQEPFFAELSMRVEKLVTTDPEIPTMAVTWSEGDFTMLVNPNFLVDCVERGGRHHVQSVFGHELFHIADDHLTGRGLVDLSSATPDDMHFANIAQDMAVNSMLVHGMGRKLPGCPWLPGLKPGRAQDDKVFEDAPTPPFTEPKREAFDKLVESAPKLGAAEDYASYLRVAWEAMRKGQRERARAAGLDPNALPAGLADLMDSHGLWNCEGMTEEDKAVMRMRAREILRQAVEKCQGVGWGSLPSSIQARLLERLTPKIDWRRELCEWAGSQNCRIEHSSSFRKINKRFPMIYPGKRRNRGLRIAAAIDMSGSMSDEMVKEVIGEVVGMADVANVTVVPFDAAVDERNVRQWEAGDNPVIPRTVSGGTSFDAVALWVSSFDRRDSFDALMMLTDGCAEMPRECIIPRVWVISHGRKLIFKTSEKVIELPKK